MEQNKTRRVKGQLLEHGQTWLEIEGMAQWEWGQRGREITYLQVAAEKQSFIRNIV